MNVRRQPEEEPIAGIELSSREMASLIVAAMIDGGVPKESDREKSEGIATEEIWIRKLLVDGPLKEGV